MTVLCASGWAGGRGHGPRSLLGSTLSTCFVPRVLFLMAVQSLAVLESLKRMVYSEAMGIRPTTKQQGLWAILQCQVRPRPSANCLECFWVVTWAACASSLGPPGRVHSPLPEPRGSVHGKGVSLAPQATQAALTKPWAASTRRTRATHSG